MRVLITGVCGFVGSAVAEALTLSVRVIHGDIRAASDFETLPAAPRIPLGELLEGIACHAERRPNWLERSGL